MIEETAWVVRVEDDAAWVETQRRASCGGCASKSGCGTSALAQWFGRRTVALRVDNPLGARPGEQVVIGVPESMLVRGAAWMYGLPLLTLIGGAAVAAWLGEGAGDDLVTGVGGVLGLALGFVVARRHQGAGPNLADGPRIVRRDQQYVTFRAPTNT